MSELDIKILNIACSERKELNELYSSVGESVFDYDYRRFIKNLFNYYNSFQSCPTLETLIEFSAKNNPNLQEYLQEKWAAIHTVQVDKREFKFILEKIKRRYNLNILNILKDKVVDISDDNLDLVNEVVNKVSGEIKTIGSKKIYKEISLHEHVDDWITKFKAKQSNKELAEGIMTGFSVMDYYTNGLRKKELLLIGADTGGGKSIYLINQAVNFYLGRNKIPTNVKELNEKINNKSWERAYNGIFFSLEMGADEVVERIIANMAGVDSLDVMKGNVTEEDIKRLNIALKYWKNSPNRLKIIEMPRGCSMIDIQRIYDEVTEDFLPDYVVIDYLGIMIEGEAKSDADWEKLQRISEQMHEFARVNDCLVISAFQLTKVKPGEGGIGIYRIGRCKNIADNANIVLQIEAREDEQLRLDSRIHCIKFRRGPLFIMNNLKKEFKYCKFLDLGFNGDKPQEEVRSNGEDLTGIMEEIFGEEI